ncbi:MAG TPA: tetratricopeptide repeat protein [Bacteroidia bacterium]|nr:tetratricopeptide repeat protein [Bacteroidia bacterium]
MELDAAVADPYFYRGNMFFGRNDFTHALADYKKATELNPGYAQAFYNMGVCYNSLQNFTEAETVLTRSLNLQPNEFTYQVRANTYFYTKQYVKAIADYSGALKLNPNMPGVYNDRGVCYLYLQDKQKACADWKTAAEMGFQRSAELLANYCK